MAKKKSKSKKSTSKKMTKGLRRAKCVNKQRGKGVSLSVARSRCGVKGR